MPVTARFIQTENREYMRDTKSYGLLATNREALQRNRNQRSRSAQQRQEVISLRSRCDILESRLNQIAQSIENISRIRA